MSSKKDITEHTSDAQLWSSMLQGNVQSLSDLYRKYYMPLFLYGKKLSARTNLAEDSVQDLFYKMWKNRDNLSQTSSTRSYIFKAYRRIVLDKLMISKNTITTDIADHGEPEISVQDLIIQDETDTERLALIKQGMETLPARQREILYLRFFKGMEYKEIAKVLDINYQSVRNSIHKSLISLRKVLMSFLLFLLFW